MADELELGEVTNEEQGGKKPGKMLPLVFALVAAGGGGALGTTFLGPAVAPALAARAENGGGGGHGGGGHGSGPVETFHLLDNLVVNPAESEGTRYLLVSIAIEPNDQNMVETLASLDVSFRHKLLTILGSKTVEELSDIGHRSALVDELKGALESLVGKGTIHRIYLPQYVIQ
jgi:flagellar FliL protein